MKSVSFFLFVSLTSLPCAAFSADAEKGTELFKKQCSACHVATEPKNKVGPHLLGVVGRKVASVDGFRYSSAMKDFASNGKLWDAETLTHYLPKPRDLVKGTSMAFAGVKDETSVQDIIEYLKTTSPQQ